MNSNSYEACISQQGPSSGDIGSYEVVVSKIEGGI